MSRSRPRPILCALMCMAFVVGVAILSGCTNVPLGLHSWGDGKWGWADFDGRCSDDCGT